MANKVTWTVDYSSASITSFTVHKSVDSGSSYTVLATVAFNVNGANYDKPKGLFFYDDAAGNPGDVYYIVATGPDGDSDPIFYIPPPGEPQRCVVIGYLLDAFGNPDQGAYVEVTGSARPTERWATNPAGLVSRDARALGILPASMRVYPDINGMWQVSLVRKTFARFSIPSLDFEKDVEVPDAIGPYNIRDLQGLTGGDAIGLYQAGPGLRGSIPRA